MCIPIIMVISAVWLGIKYEHLFRLPQREINDRITMDSYRADFGINDDEN